MYILFDLVVIIIRIDVIRKFEFENKDVYIRKRLFMVELSLVINVRKLF